MEPFEELSREELLKLIQVYAKYWLANDGCFFLAGEEGFSKIAPELEVKSPKQSAEAETRRLMPAFAILSDGELTT